VGTWFIEIACGACKMFQRLILNGITREQAETYAAVIDGTAPFYAVPVPEDSGIGICTVCGGRFRAKARGASGAFEPGIGGGV
jgi:hypothetical protein